MDSSPDIFNVTSALGRGIPDPCRRRRSRSTTFNVTSALGPKDTFLVGHGQRVEYSASTSPRCWAEGYVGRGDRALLSSGASTSPRRWAEEYLREAHRGGVGRVPSTSPRRLGRGILWGAVIAMFMHPVLQHHLGAGPRDTWRDTDTTNRTSSTFNVTSALGRGILGRFELRLGRDASLQRHLGAGPRDTMSVPSTS